MKKFRRAIILISLLSAMRLTGCSSKETKTFKEYFDNGDYATASTYYESNKSSIKIDNLADLLSNAADSIVNEFISGNMTLSTATDNIKALLSIAPSDSKDYLNEKLTVLSSISTSQEQYKRGVECFDNQNYKEAVTYFEKVIEQDPFYADAQSKLKIASSKVADEYQEMISDTEEKIENYISQGKFKEAAQTFDDFKNKCSESDMIEKMSSEIESKIETEMQEKVDSFFAKYDYSGASDYLKGLSRNFNYDSITKKIEDLDNDFVDYVIKKAENDANENNFESACAIIETAMKNLGEDNLKLKDAYSEYHKHIPIYLAEMEYLSCEGAVSVDNSLVDNTDGTHQHALYVDGLGQKLYYVEYLLDGNYEKLTGVCACSYYNRSSKESKYFEIYGDGKLIYTSPTMTSGSTPEKMDISVSEVKILKIVYPATEGNNTIATIFDALLTPKAEE